MTEHKTLPPALKKAFESLEEATAQDKQRIEAGILPDSFKGQDPKSEVVLRTLEAILDPSDAFPQDNDPV